MSPLSALAPSFACETHCPYCALQCGMNLVELGGRTTVAKRDFPTNRGGLCQKGWTAAELLDHPERLTYPLIREGRGQPLRRASWDEALGRVVSGIAAAQERYGRDSVGVFGGGGLTNEAAYLLGKFTRVALRSSQIDYNGRFCMASAAAASIKAFGVDRGLPFPLADIPKAEAILLIGSNIAETMPPIMQYFDEQKRNGGSLIVVDPRATPTAAAATLHLQITPGADAALANGLLYVAIKEGYIDQGFIDARTSGFDAVRRSVSTYWPDRVERITGIPEKQLFLAARLLGKAASAMILTARGPEQQSTGVNNVLAFINLALALGKAGRPHSGYGCLTGQGNGQGGREHGQKADQLPGSGSWTIWRTAPILRACGECGKKICRHPASPHTKCWTGWGRKAACALCLSSRRTSRSRRRDPRTSNNGSMLSTFWWSPTFFFPKPPSAPTWCFPARSGPRWRGR